MYFKDNVLKQEGIQYKGKNRALATLNNTVLLWTDALVTGLGTRCPLPFMPGLGFGLLYLGVGGDYKKAASKEVMALFFQLVPSSIDKILIYFCCYKVKMLSRIQDPNTLLNIIRVCLIFKADHSRSLFKETLSFQMPTWHYPSPRGN